MKPSITYLSQKEILYLHNQSLLMLREIGMKMPHEETLTLLKYHGLTIYFAWQ